MAVSISVQAIGAFTPEDRRGMIYVIEKENARRAALDPPGTPLPLSDNIEIRNSYEVVTTATMQAAHDSYIEQSNVASLRDVRTVWDAATDAQRNAALAALTS